MKRTFRCSFCSKEFKREVWYKKHACTKKQRFLDENNLHNIAGHRLFNYWQERTGLLRLGKPKTFEEYCKSPYFNTFKRLAEFVDENSDDIITGFKYVDWLVDQDIKEQAWFHKRGLERYRDWLRRKEEPEQQAEETCKNILEWCEGRAEEPREFFKRITPGQALSMIRRNQLSPWVLFAYDPATIDLLDRFHGETLFTLREHINIEYWLNKATDEESVAKVSRICQERLNDNRNT